MEEIWKDVPGYEGYYQVSNLGKVKSIQRSVIGRNDSFRILFSRTLRATLCRGYLHVDLCMASIRKSFQVHQLVAIAFLAHVPSGHKLVVDHINGDKTDNRALNLRIVTHRENLSTCFRKDVDTLTSKYTGVHKGNNNGKWRAGIQVNGKSKHLGYFVSEQDAAYAYQKALKKYV